MLPCEYGTSPSPNNANGKLHSRTSFAASKLSIVHNELHVWVVSLFVAVHHMYSTALLTAAASPRVAVPVAGASAVAAAVAAPA